MDRHARKGLTMTRWRVRVGWWFTVDRHGLCPRDDKVEGAGRLVVHSGSPRAFSPRDDKSDGFPFTLHPSPFTLPSLAFLETYTEADGVAAVTGVAVAALS